MFAPGFEPESPLIYTLLLKGGSQKDHLQISGLGPISVIIIFEKYVLLLHFHPVFMDMVESLLISSL